MGFPSGDDPEDQRRNADGGAHARRATDGIRIGEWRVEPSLNRLTGFRTTIRIEPKLMDVLTVLADNAGRVVSKQELLDAVWSREHLAESVLTRAIAELRRVLRDDAHAPRYIETISKRGYRLIAIVTPIDEHTGAHTAPSGAVHRPAATRWLLVAAAVLAAAAVLVWLLARLRPAGGPAPSGGARKVAPTGAGCLSSP